MVGLFLTQYLSFYPYSSYSFQTYPYFRRFCQEQYERRKTQEITIQKQKPCKKRQNKSQNQQEALVKNEEQNSSEKVQLKKEYFSSEFNIQNKTNLKRIKGRKTDDYQPFKNCKKRIKKGSQNIKRNIVPNILRQIFSFIQKRKRSEYFVKKFVKQAQIQGVSESRFFTYQNFIKQKLNTYINDNILKQFSIIQEPSCKIYSIEEQKLYLSIDRILAQYFLSKQLDIAILTSNRMKPESRGFYLQVKREIKEKFRSHLIQKKKS